MTWQRGRGRPKNDGDSRKSDENDEDEDTMSHACTTLIVTSHQAPTQHPPCTPPRMHSLPPRTHARTHLCMHSHHTPVRLPSFMHALSPCVPVLTRTPSLPARLPHTPAYTPSLPARAHTYSCMHTHHPPAFTIPTRQRG